MNVLHLQKKFAFVLRPLARGYAKAMRQRNKKYLQAGGNVHPKRFTVSVGNISWGGSGKTPLTEWILGWAAQKKLRSAVLTRGYGGKSNIRPLLVTETTSPLASGDEPLMLARAYPDAIILADPVRVRSIKWLQNNQAAIPYPDIFILDDAMQHLAVQRDLNLVILKPSDLQHDWDKVIPAGSWREGAIALTRADAFLLRCPEGEFTVLAKLAATKLAEFGKPLFSFDLTPKALIPLTLPSGKADDAVGQYALCCAVGSPDSVLRSAIDFTGYAPAKQFIFKDHHVFTSTDIQMMLSLDIPILVTAKDAVKLVPLQSSFDLSRFFILQSCISWGENLFTSESFQEWFEAAFTTYQQTNKVDS